MIFTTNKPLNAWGRVLHDDDLAHAIVDRILERGRMLTLDGPSMRTKHLGLDDTTPSKASDQLATISGIEAPEFPEPTSVVYDDLRNPYHSSTNEMLPESLADDALAKNGYELLGRRFSDEDLVRWVVRDVGESFRLNMLTFCLEPWMKQEKALSALFGRTRL